MAIHGTTGFCSACKEDALFQRDYGTPDDTPLLCPKGHSFAEFGGSRDQKRNTGIIERHNPYEYPSEKSGAWFQGRAGITTEQARAIQRRNKIRGDNSKRDKYGGRLRASIPAALFFAQKRMHGMQFFQDKRHMDRICKDWEVHGDRK